MKKLLFITFTLLTLSCYSQNNRKIEIPETYELSNIILALTKYGISDKWEVQKKTDYYNKVLDYFQPVKNHQLLDSVNYSREKWEDFLSFRTDAIAFSFDKNGNLKRDYEFYTNKGHKPFDKNLDLVNDFVKKSKFREFYTLNKAFYDRIIKNYKDYNYINETIQFLDKIFEKKQVVSSNSEYLIILSPLVFRMNCHRNLSENITADFPSATEDFINGIESNTNIEDRLNSNHLIFTEKDHEYVNPITDKYKSLVKANFNTKFWDKESGYQGLNSFNEYMTWAAYDLFITESFPKVADYLALQWQYQNASRGFIAQNLFAKKVSELYFAQKGNRRIEKVYRPLLKWCKKIENKISQPTLLNIDTKNFIKIDTTNLSFDFSEEMQTNGSFNLKIYEFKNGKQTGKEKLIIVDNAVWTNNSKKMTFKLDTDFEEFVIEFNWWGMEKPLISKNGIMLKPQSYVLLKK